MNVAIMVIVLLLFLDAWWSTNKKRNQILCRYIGRDKTEEEKWINADKGYVIFRGKRFEVITRRIINLWLTRGIHWLFPTKVSCLHYSWNNSYPHDPDNYQQNWETPEVRGAINTSELVQSFYRTSTPSIAKKQTMLQAYLPFVSLIAVVLLFFWVYSNFQQIATTLAAIQNAMNALAR